MPQDRKRRTFDNVGPSSFLAGAGVGGIGLGNLSSNILEEAVGNRHPRFNKDTLSLVDRFAGSLGDRSDWADFMQNYAQSGHNAAKAPLFEGSVKSVAEEMNLGLKERLGKAVGKRVKNLVSSRLGKATIAPVAKMFGVDLSPKSVDTWLSKALHEAKDIMGAAHYSSFALSPRDAYIKMVAEGKGLDTTTIGDLADAIIEARNRYNSASNFAGRKFSTPEQYFSWLQRDIIGLASSRPVRSDFVSDKAFRGAMKDFKRYGGKNPVFSSLFREAEQFKDKNALVEALSAGRHDAKLSPSQVAKQSIGEVMSKIVGSTNNWERLPDGNLVVKGKQAIPGFRSFSDLVQNKTLLQHYVEPRIGRFFRSAPGNYKLFANVGRVLQTLAGRRFKLLSALAALGGTGMAYHQIAKNRSARIDGPITKSGQANDSSEGGFSYKDLIALLAGGGSATAAAGYGRRFKPRDLNPFADVHASLIGGTKMYDAAARDAMGSSVKLANTAQEVLASGNPRRIQGFIRRLEQVKTPNNPFFQEQLRLILAEAQKVLSGTASATTMESFLPQRVAQALRLDSFSSQTHAAADALRRNGVVIDELIPRATNYAVDKARVYDPYQAYLPSNLSAESLRKPDAFVQVGMHPQEDLLRNERLFRGAKAYRVSSDFGPGNFRQPDRWLDGQNWMKINDPKLYDRIVTPGLSHFEAKGEMGPGMRGLKKSVGVDNIAVSPVFEHTKFSDRLATHTGKGRVKAMYTFGGGAGGFLGLGEPTNIAKKQFQLSGQGILDDMLYALRKTHGDNFDFDLYVGNALDDVNVKQYMGSGGYVDKQLPHARALRRKLKLLEHVTMSDAEREAKGLKPLTRRQKMLREKFKGLHVVRGVPQSRIANAYANSDIGFLVPGSTSAEVASIKDNAKGIRGKFISIIPDEDLKGRLKPGQENWMARHFTPNADYLESLIPGTERVSMRSATRREDLAKIVADTAAKAKTSTTSAARKSIDTKGTWDTFAKILKRDVRLGRLGRLGKLGLIATPALAAAGYGAIRAAPDSKVAPLQIGEAPSIIDKDTTRPGLGQYGALAAGGAVLTALALHLRNRRRRKQRAAGGSD